MLLRLHTPADREADLEKRTDGLGVVKIVSFLQARCQCKRSHEQQCSTDSYFYIFSVCFDYM